MKQIGLKFLLRGGAFVCAVMEESKAREAIALWMQGKLPPIGGETTAQQSWAVKTEEVVAIHTFDLVPEGQPAQQQIGRWQPGTSGVR